MFVSPLLLLSFAARGSSADSKGFTDRDTFALEWATEPRISPNAKSVVYVRRGFDIITDRRTSRLWSLDIASGTHLPLTSTGSNPSTPRCSPGGDRIAYISSANENSGSNSGKGAQLFVYWLKFNRAARLSRLTEGPRSLTWSPDGKRLAFSMLVPDSAPAVSPNGRYLAYVGSNDKIQGYQISLLKPKV